MPKPTPEELKKLEDAGVWLAGKGEDVGVLAKIYEIGKEQAAQDPPK